MRCTFSSGADASICCEVQETVLGISIYTRDVVRIDGDIEFESESAVGKGSAFWFTLPFEPVPEGTELIDGAATASRPSAGGRKLSILVAEDNEINQVIIKAMLARMGHTCTMANNGAEAVEAVRNGDFDLILMDIRMPKLSGPDAARKIRQLPGGKAGIPIIALTADVLAENRQSCFDAGMADCIAKPIDREELADAIDKAFREAAGTVDGSGDTESRQDPEFALDIQDVTSRLGLPEATVLPLLQKFSSRYADVAGQFQTLVEAGSFDAVKELGHSLKGVAGSLGMTGISECASRIEVAAKSGDADEIDLNIAVLAKLMQGAVKSIDGLTAR